QLVAQQLRVIDRTLNQYEPASRVIPTNVDEHGRVLDRNLGVINESRNLYGVVKAYTFTGDPFYLARAKEIAGAYLEMFVNRSATPPYFFQEIVVSDKGTLAPKPLEHLSVNHQAYGLAGLVAFCNATKDSQVLGEVRTLHDGFVKRFLDPKEGGFFEEVSLTSGE